MSRYRDWASGAWLVDTFSAATPGAWASTTVLAAAIVAAVTLVPGVNSYFALNWVPAAAVYSLAPLADLTAERLYRTGADPAIALAFSLVGSTFLQVFCALLIAFSSIEGAPALSVLFLFTAGYHGFCYRATLRTPYIAVGTLGALVVAFLANPEPARVPILVLVTLASLGAAFLVGTSAARADESRSAAERVKAALQARMLEDQSVRAEQLGAAVEQFSMWNHDMRNSVTVAMGNLTVLRRLKAPELQESNRAVLDSSLADLGRSLEVVATGLEKMRSVVRGAAPAPAAEKVEVTPVVEAVGTAARARFPQLKLATPSMLPVSVLVRGGSVSLYRLLENLIVNAAEGDGQRGASAVALSVGWKDGIAALEVYDDGPGFKAEQLEKPIAGFETTKVQGTGLGLYTVERLVAASGGSVHRANRPEGGASVVVRLPCETEA